MRFAIDRDRSAALGVEQDDADRRDVDQGLEVGPGALFVAQPSRVGDRHRRLGGEQAQGFLVVGAERRLSLLLGEIEVAHVPSAMPDGRAEEAAERDRQPGHAERSEVTSSVDNAQRLRDRVEVLKELEASRQVEQGLMLVVAEARGDEVDHLSRGVQRGQAAAAGIGQRTRGVQHLAQDGVEFEVFADSQSGLVEPGEASAQDGVFASQCIGVLLTRHLPTHLQVSANGTNGPEHAN